MHSHPIEFSVGLGFLLGMLHALEPGHGKTAMFVYMLRRRSAFWHPVVMGLTTAFSHAFSLAIIASVVHLGAHWLAGDTHHGEQAVSACLQWLSSLILVGIGVRLLFLAKTQVAKPRRCSCCGGAQTGRMNVASHCDHPTELVTISAADAREQTREESLPAKLSNPTASAQLRMTLLLGFAIGMLPCPTALAAYFAGLSSGDPWEGYRVIAVFSAGIAVSLALCGFILQWIGERLSRWLPSERSARRLAFAQAGVILMIGLMHLVQLAMGHVDH